jgi:predicted transglutaminase-like cysteine proteinase
VTEPVARVGPSLSPRLPVRATRSRRARIGALVLALASLHTAASARIPYCVALDLPVARVEGPPSQYVAFCESNPSACVLTGEPVIEWTLEVHELMARINVEVNTEVDFIPDPENSGMEETWSFPENCTGDCEDYALEKRRRLVDTGLPSAALRMAIAFHEMQFFPHAILTVETTTGTWILDNLDDEVRCWDGVPYTYTRREEPGGLWARFRPP